jgi:hypothetical protein
MTPDWLSYSEGPRATESLRVLHAVTAIDEQENIAKIEEANPVGSQGNYGRREIDSHHSEVSKSKSS